ncbi:MAG: Gfo/Idh/MocA family oxidoreductase [Nanoarchaeota archaeon]
MKLKVAVIGAGAMGKNHARVYSEMKNVELVAVCDSSKEVGGQIAALYGAKYYSDYKDMLAKEKLDAVSICVPTKFHREVSIAVIKKKINVLVEKPIATTVSEAEEIISEAQKNKVKLMIGHIECFNPVVVELKRRIAGGELGKIYKVHCNRMGPSVQRIYDVGVIIDIAIHEIYILKYLIDSDVKRVYAETERKIHSTHEDLLIGTIRFSNDVLGVINANWITPRKFREITVTGEKGMFVANYLTQDLDFYENDFVKKNIDYKSHTMLVMEGKKIPIDVKKSEPLRNELDAFVDCVLNDKKVPVTGNEGLEALRVAQKFLESSKQNKVMEL